MLNICIAGAAGDGVKEAGEILGKLLAGMGYSVFTYQEYESMIRGGHNASVVRCSKEKIHSHSWRYDILVCLEDYVFEYHKNRLNGILLYDSKFEIDHEKSLAIPMSEFVKKNHISNIFRNAAALGALCYLLGVDLSRLHKQFMNEYGEKARDDIEISALAYDYVSRKYEQYLELEIVGEARTLKSGSEAISLGMVEAGLERYYAYPMTPATPILHFLAKRRLCLTVQPENEIAAIMMAVGSAFAGKRSAVGTSGGGFALMSESISLAGMAEVPVLIVLAQRSGPSTGMATYTAQQDLYFALNPAHGEFPVIVASPLTISDAYQMAAELLNLAWKFQTPTVLLTEKHLMESYETVEFGSVAVEEVEIFNSESEEIFPRYELTESGVSRYATPPAIVKANSNEHTEYGITTDDAKTAEKMYAKRMRKEKAIQQEVGARDPYVVVKRGKEVVVTWGSTFGAVVEAAEELGYSVVGVRYLRPLFLPELDGEVICVECNHTGLLAGMIESKIGRKVRKVLRWDGRPFTPEEIKGRLSAGR